MPLLPTHLLACALSAPHRLQFRHPMTSHVARSPARHLPVHLVAEEENATDSSGGYDAFREVGGEYELDLGEMKQLLELYEGANKRWALGDGGLKQGGVMDDSGSVLSQWWSDPVDGPEGTLKTQMRMRQLKHRTDLVVRPAFLTAACALGLRAPVAVARVSAWLGLSVHLLLPFLRIIAAKAQRVLTPTPPKPKRKPMPVVDATTLLASQHLTGALAACVTAPLLWSSGAWFASLLVAALGRLALLPGLWLWRDLNSELCTLSTRGTVAARAANAAKLTTRVWRLVATALCVAEATLLLRTILCLGRVERAIGAVGGAAVALLTLVPVDVATAAPSLLGPLGPLCLLGGAAPLSALGVKGWVGLAGDALAVCMALYAAYWLAFPAEAGERNWWRARLGDPRKSDGVAALSSALWLVGPGVGRPSSRVSELLREKAMRDDVSGGERARVAELDARAEEAWRFAFGTPGRQRDPQADDDLRRMMWALGPSDAIESEFMTSATIGGADDDSGAAFPGLVDNSIVAVPGESKRATAIGEDDEWAYMELARLLATEDEARARRVQKRRARRIEQGEEPDEVDAVDDDEEKDDTAWTRLVGETFVEEEFARQAAKFGKDPASRGILAELLRFQFSLERWASDPPPGAKGLDQRNVQAFETALDEKRDRRKVQRNMAKSDKASPLTSSKPVVASPLDDAAPADGMVADMEEGVDALELGEASVAPASGTARLREEGEEEEGDEGDELLFV